MESQQFASTLDQRMSREKNCCVREPRTTREKEKMFIFSRFGRDTGRESWARWERKYNIKCCCETLQHWTVGFFALRTSSIFSETWLRAHKYENFSTVDDSFDFRENIVSRSQVELSRWRHVSSINAVLFWLRQIDFLPKRCLEENYSILIMFTDELSSRWEKSRIESNIIAGWSLLKKLWNSKWKANKLFNRK